MINVGLQNAVDRACWTIEPGEIEEFNPLQSYLVERTGLF